MGKELSSVLEATIDAKPDTDHRKPKERRLGNDLLGALLHHLNAVAQNSQQNKMDVTNLARVFAPTVVCRDQGRGPSPKRTPLVCGGQKRE